MTEGLYVHIPFCKRRCAYCGLPSTAGRQAELDSYLASLLIEAQKRCVGRTFSTLFLGGGTPSILSPQQLTGLFEGLLSVIELSPEAEVSIEVNPDTVTSEWVDALGKTPVNRVSIGVQSFVEKECKHLGRLHTPQQAEEAFGLLRRAGQNNISLDLIAGFPTHTLHSFKTSLSRACALEPEHLSLYLYHREDGTLYDEKLSAGALCEVDEDEQAEMYYVMREYLMAHGYEHYEISNFARPGRQCKHNVNYWVGGEYCGLGAGASSHEDGARFSNVLDPRDYAQMMTHTGDAVAEREELPLARKWRETMMLRLRLLRPTDLSSVKPLPDSATFEDVKRTLSQCAKEGLVDEVGEKFVLSTRALTVANEVLARVI